MTQAQIKELKQRFREMLAEKMEEWEATHPEPVLDIAAVTFDLAHGHCEPDPERLRRLLEGDFHHFTDESLAKMFGTRTQREWLAARAAHQTAEKAQKHALGEAMEQFLDRVLFDHESAFLALRDFKAYQVEGSAA